MELGEGEAIKENFVSPDIPLMTEAERAEMEQDEISQLSSGAKSKTGATKETDPLKAFGGAGPDVDTGTGTGAGTGDTGGKTDEPYNPYGALLESAMKMLRRYREKTLMLLQKKNI